MENRETEILDLLNKPIENFADRSSRWLFEMEVESMAESIIEQSRKQGLEQGLEQGETRAKREAILKLLQVRFDVVPEVLTRKISVMQNRSLLDSLFEKVATAQTLDDIDWENPNN